MTLKVWGRMTPKPRDTTKAIQANSERYWSGHWTAREWIRQ